MNYPSIKTIMERLGVDKEKAKRIRGLMDKTVNTRTSEAVKAWEKQCYNTPRWCERVMVALNEELDGFGTETIEGEYVDSFFGNIVAEYVNMGDTYDVTIVRNTETGRFYITSWGDYYESLEKRGKVNG